MSEQNPTAPLADHSPLVLLKLGGSLITDKTRPETALPAVLAQLAQEIAQVRRAAPELRIVLGHGSGSFGHMAARRHGTRGGVHGPAAWLGFAQVADAAARLDRLVVAALLAEGIPVWAVQPSAGGWCVDGQMATWATEVVAMALARGLVPLVYGDAMLDRARGGTIASTEELFAWLVEHLAPDRIVLAGTVDGVYDDDPLSNPAARRWPEITPADLPRLSASLGGSHGVDVTGGMLSKVTEMVNLVQAHAGLRVRLVSGLRPGAVMAALLDQPDAGGTLIHQG